MFVELHIIQNFAPSCLNRDDTNTPKDCEFGGHRRARISSQCLKRAIRQSPDFKKVIQMELGMRTKLLKGQLMKRLEEARKTPEETESILPSFIKSLVSKLDSKKPEQTAVLLYLAPEEIDRMRDSLLTNWNALAAAAKKPPKPSKEAKDGESKKSSLDAACEEAIKAYNYKTRPKSPDIGLFGRMMAEKPEMGVDAACQVAHAISTNRVTMEMDYYTAVDDLKPKAETGAEMVGFTGYNSSCFYRYSVVDIGQLLWNLQSDETLARITIEAFLRASVAAIPTGKQTSTAAHNPPEAVFAVVRSDAPLSLANAFQVPVKPDGQGLSAASISAMDKYWGKLRKMYGEGGVKKAAICYLPDVTLTELKKYEAPSFKELVEWTMGALEFKAVGH